ncbi:nuclear pore complex protein NUP96 [Salvia miltiorrhiza]|uniref:nuclear pore complex protein NUP96 n=1 Tax=Salvia miltiorrhiza TaxID=226208 RepID=UPI0025AB8E7A|nr:nuclear pore complex protein NUP96 [Salvia miltiorrhiza]XP_057790499.1 nuclear pore complex protein NUP96 [Salvia miltiorrhiza]XP_057790500.1 nuclear pore complex protein NUP96 [Salvia miltiorrhiza]XP_057790501.1 nuclear pore complex protein NUP96 [Salvia miltiorrhiza]
MEVNLALLKPTSIHESQYKRRRVSLNGAATSLSCQLLHDAENSLPTLHCSDYYTKPCISELAIREFSNPGYCSRVEDFVIGRVGYGCVKFIGETDVRCLDLDSIVKFRRCEIVIYEDDSSKPLVGHGLNKPAEVTLLLQTKPLGHLNEAELKKVVEKLKCKAESQGARFISFNPVNREWKFSVQHFSRFGLGEEDEDDVPMDDVSPGDQDAEGMNGSEVSDDKDNASEYQTLLSHSLPAHLGLDPDRMKDLRMLLFPTKEDEVEGLTSRLPYDNPPFAKDSSRSPLHHSSRKTVHNSNTPSIRKTPLALKEYNPGGFSSLSPGAILMSQQNKGLHLTTGKSEGFELDLTKKTPVTGSHSCNIVDAALFMGRSFRVGWGPNGILVHSGMPVGSDNSQAVLSSVINIEKVALDKVTRDESNKVKEELTEFCFSSPLNIHKELSCETKKVELGAFNLKLQKVICDRLTLPDICRSYIDIIEKQLEVPSLSSATRVLLMHQVLVWELIKVLFSSRKMGGQLKLTEEEADEEVDMIPDVKESYPDVDQEAVPLIRRAAFSYWLQESVHHRVQEDISSLNELSDLEHIFFLLSGRQMDAAVELAASRGDVRLSCLLSQAGGSTASRADIAHQLVLWRKNGLDFSFIEEDRVRLLELLAGNIHRALHGVKIDWKRFLGLLMWYKLPPDISLPVVFNTYQKLLNEGDAPYPVPVYIDEGPVEDVSNWVLNNRFDLAYYLMLLHAREENDFGALKTMFSASASTNDPLDYHMIWHQRAILEAIGTFSSNDLHVLDMAFVSQLLCLGQCHWAIYVVLHMPHREDYPYLQATVIREILFQYCEVWSTHDSQWEFIESLGIPLEWLHEALAIFYSYTGDLPKALHHFLECGIWQKAHSIFLTSVAPSLFLSQKHTEIWRLATSMEDYKSEIEFWDLGAGIYISFYILKSSMQEDNSTMTELDTLDNKNDACAVLISHLNKSLAVWGNKLSVEGRAVFSKMAEEISSLLLSDSDEGLPGEDQLNCFETIFRAPMPEDLRSYHLQDALSLFTCHLSEMAQ